MAWNRLIWNFCSTTSDLTPRLPDRQDKNEINPIGEKKCPHCAQLNGEVIVALAW